MNIPITVPDGTSGNWKVSTFTVQENEISQMISMMKYGRGVPAGTYKKLTFHNFVVMSNTPDEIRDFLYFLQQAKGSVLVNGLGLGVLLKALIDKPEVVDITVIEISEDVIKLVSPTYQSDSKVTIIHADAFTWNPPKYKRYNAVWHDIWNDISTENLDEMKRLHRKYGRISDYQASWCREKCEWHKKREKYNQRYSSYFNY